MTKNTNANRNYASIKKDHSAKSEITIDGILAIFGAKIQMPIVHCPDKFWTGIWQKVRKREKMRESSLTF